MKCLSIVIFIFILFNCTLNPFFAGNLLAGSVEKSNSIDLSLDQTIEKWKKINIEIDSKTTLDISYPLHWDLQVDRLFGRIEISHGNSVQFLNFSDNFLGSSTYIRATAQGTLNAIQSYIKKKGFVIEEDYEEISEPVESSGSGITPPTITTIGRSTLHCTKKNQNYKIIIETNVRYFKERSTFKRTPTNRTRGLGYANLIICPFELYESTYKDIFYRISSSIKKQYRRK